MLLSYRYALLQATVRTCPSVLPAVGAEILQLGELSRLGLLGISGERTYPDSAFE
jgi:hypothetical protein